MSEKINVQREGWHYTMVENAVITDSGLTTIQKMVYVALSKFADHKSNGCWPSYSKLAEVASCSKRSAIEAVKELERRGYIRKKYRKEDGEQSSNMYSIVANPQQSAADAQPGCNSCTGAVQEMHWGGAGGAPEREPSNYNQGTRDVPESDDSAPTAVESRNPGAQKHETAAQWEQALTEHVPLEAWRSIPQERRNAKLLGKATDRLCKATGDDPDDVVPHLLDTYLKLVKNAKADYWRKAPTTPTGVYQRWDAVVEAARSRQPGAGHDRLMREIYGDIEVQEVWQ